MVERWKEVFGGYYEVSSIGRVRRMRPGRGTNVGKIRKCGFDKDGYLAVALYIKGRAVRILVHRLVAKAFIGPCPKGKEVNHKDGVKKNCHWTNLEYLTKSQNQLHAYRLGLKKAKHGTLEGVEGIICGLSPRYSQRLLAKMFGVSVHAVWRHFKKCKQRKR
jgi:hypothetical protein